mmetsp:Transcript_22797/g.53225  ORF Transcript_22797/g.53225 Transcript_22797/m.53225 type:complete len:212 (-) Transcript_22797:488-1123(-)
MRPHGVEVGGQPVLEAWRETLRVDTHEAVAVVQRNPSSFCPLWHTRTYMYTAPEDRGQDLNQHSQAIALVACSLFHAPNWSEAASPDDCLGAASHLSCSIHSPASWDRLLLPVHDLHLPYRHSRCSHVQLKAIPLRSRAEATYGVRTHGALCASSWNHERRCVGECKAEQPFIERHLRPEAGYTKVVRPVAHHKSNTVCLGKFDALLHGKL